MQITISKKSRTLYDKCQPSIQKQYPIYTEDQKSFGLKNQKKAEENDLKFKPTANELCCEQSFFFKCLPNPNQKKNQLQEQVQVGHPLQANLKKSKKTLSQQAYTKQKLTTDQAKELSQVMTIKKMEENLKKVSKQTYSLKNSQQSLKSLQNNQLNLNTENCASRQVTVLSSITKQGIDSPKVSMVSFCRTEPAAKSPKKITLTVSQKSRKNEEQNIQIVDNNRFQGISSSKKQAQTIVLRQAQGSRKNSYYFSDKNVQSSQSEFRIVDPFEELRSIDTEYLKNKIAFSSVQSQKQQHRHTQQSIFCIKDNSSKHFTKKAFKPQFCTEKYCQGTTLKKLSFSVSQSSNSQKSFTFEKNFQQVFHLSIPAFSKVSTSQQNLKEVK